MHPLIFLVAGLVVGVDPCVREMPVERLRPTPQFDENHKLCRMPLCRNQSLPELPLCPMPKDSPQSGE